MGSMPLRAIPRQKAPGKKQGNHAQGQVQPKHRTPAKLAGKITPQPRTDGIDHAEHGAQQHLPAQPLAGVGKQLRHTGKGGTDQHAAAHTLQGSPDHQHQHAVCQCAEQRGQREDDCGGQHERFAPVKIAQPAKDRDGHDRGQQIAGGDPGVQLETVELGDNAGQCVADDRLIQRGKAQHQ